MSNDSFINSLILRLFTICSEGTTCLLYNNKYKILDMFFFLLCKKQLHTIFSALYYETTFAFLVTTPWYQWPNHLFLSTCFHSLVYGYMSIICLTTEIFSYHNFHVVLSLSLVYYIFHLIWCSCIFLYLIVCIWRIVK